MFTNEEIEMLRNNPYTYAVTPHILSFTKAFKNLPESVKFNFS